MQHPTITNAMRYGYPTPPEQHFCIICGAPASCWGDTSGYKCFDCARDEFEALPDIEAVELLGFEVINE